MQDFLQPALSCVPHKVLRDPAQLYEILKQGTNFSHCQSLVPDGECLQRIGLLHLNGTLIYSIAGTAFEARISHSDDLHLIACMAGERHIDAEGGSVLMKEGSAVLLPTGLRHSRGCQSLVSIQIKPDAVAIAAAAIAGISGYPKRRRQGLSRFTPLTLQPHGSAAPIHALIRSIDTCAQVDPLLPERLGLDDVLHRCVAALLEPALLHEQPADLLRFRDAEGRNSFDDLIDYIRANLHQPLRLSDLEARSHYSRRALQYAFRERLQCTPKQWIRQQRLELAMRQLQDPDGPTSVGAVALRCGYSNCSAFSADFKVRYGLNPNQVLRGW